MPKQSQLQPAKFSKLSSAPIGAAIHLKGAESTWSVLVAMERARLMEGAGHKIHWLMPPAGKIASPLAVPTGDLSVQIGEGNRAWHLALPPDQARDMKADNVDVHRH